MLQNALNDWYGNGRGLDIWWNLKVSIHGGFESVFWNYQQLIKGTKDGINLVRFEGRPILWNQDRPLYYYPIKSQRTPVYQQELFNGWLYLFLRGPIDLLEDIKQALLSPNKVLSLGRSEDVIFVRRTEFVEPTKQYKAKGVIFAYPTYIRLPNELLRIERFPAYFIPIKVVFRNNGKPVKHKAEISSNTERDVEFESVLYAGVGYVAKLTEKVWVERFDINELLNVNDLKPFKILSDYGWL
jgi:CRISPR-associated protein Cas5t